MKGLETALHLFHGRGLRVAGFGRGVKGREHDGCQLCLDVPGA